MADLITRPGTRSAVEPDSLAERLLDTQAPQRPQSSPRIRIEVDGRVVEGFEGQTILEVCRDNGIECPSHIDIPGFLKANAEADWRESARIFKRTIPFPSVLGRVCPAPCEEHCR